MKRIKFIKSYMTIFHHWNVGDETFIIGEGSESYVVYDQRNLSKGYAFYTAWSKNNNPNFIEGKDFIYVNKFKRKDLL